MRIGSGLLLLIAGLGACLGAALVSKSQQSGQEDGRGGVQGKQTQGKEHAQPEEGPLRPGPQIARPKTSTLEAVEAPDDLGERAFAYAEKLVSFGPRYPGQPGWSKQLDLIEKTLTDLGLEVERDTWTDRKELITFTNLSAKIPGKRDERIVLGCHHDTKCTVDLPEPEHNFHFVGANDGASGVALLLALAPVLLESEREATVELVFFDGEESLDWRWNEAARALFGSKRYVRRHREALLLGDEPRIEAMILVDMVGRTDLHIQEELYSTFRMREIAWSAAVASGHQQSFFQRAEGADDDHSPFLRVGIPAIDLIDLNGNPYWHTKDDTMEHLSAHSLQKVADVVLTMLPEVERAYVTERR